MTDTTTTNPEAAPPRDYGNGDQWANEGDYYVPPDLRPFYADAEPTDLERAGYVKNGAHISETGTREITRVVSVGNADNEPVVVTETEPINNFVDIEGRSGYPTWLHRKRLSLAQQAKRHADFRKVMESYWQRCSVCGVRDDSVNSQRVFYGGAEVYVTGCTAHAPVLADAARAALVARAADQRTPDGRRVGDVAADVVATRLNRKDGAA